MPNPSWKYLLRTASRARSTDFVMEYVRGRSVRKLIQDGERPSWEEVVDIYRGAGRGLAAAHDAGVIHGDFKPGNILLDGDNWPRVADFGLAQVMIEHAPDEERHKLRHRGGTLSYMAPEVLRRSAADARSDQWSFCVALWETLEGVLPFLGRTPELLLEEIERGELDCVGTEVPEAVRAVLRRGLSVDPGERYPSMHALLAELDRLREAAADPGPEVAWAEPPGVEGRSSGGSRRGALVIALCVVGFVLLGAWSLERGLWSRPAVEQALPKLPLPGWSGTQCALGGIAQSAVEVDASMRGVCILIRQGAFHEAHELWVDQHAAREPHPADPDAQKWIKLAMQTSIVAQTFADQAERLKKRDPDLAYKATVSAEWWELSALKDSERARQKSDTDEDLVERTLPVPVDAESALGEAENSATN